MQIKPFNIGYGVTVLGASSVRSELDGIGYYTQELGARLAATGHRLKPYQFGHTGLDAFQGQRVHDWPGYPQTTLLSALTDLSLPGSSRLKGQVDLFHSTDHYIPLIKSVPHVATLMDAIPISNPEWMASRFRGLKNRIRKTTAQWPDHIITISEYSKSQLIEHFGLKSEDISISYLGVDDRYFARLDEEVIRSHVRARGLGEQFFLFVGTLQPRKNLGNLVDAHRMLPPHIRKAFPLVIVGRVGWGETNWKALFSQEHVFWFQQTTDLEKRTLMQQATAMVFPSLAEGFGLPVIEAFASSLPVIASNTTSIPEVAGDAALLVDPKDTGMISEAMMTLAVNESVRQEMRQKGLARAAQFTWEACAAATLKAYQRVL